MIIDTVKTALEKMNIEYCKLSTLDYSNLRINGSAKERLLKEKYLERPFAYEFYHQLRELIDNGEVDFGGPIIQAEVDKRYQHCFENGKVPDFIIHIPNTDKNLIVIEFKLASNLRNIEEDFKKLVEFRQALNYEYLIQVIIGDSSSLERARNHIKERISDDGERIIIVEFNVENWRTRNWEIRYGSNVA